MEGRKEGERNKVCQKKRVVQSNSPMPWPLLTGLWGWCLSWEPACVVCASLMPSFPLFLGGLWAGGGAQAPFSFSFCGALPLEPALQRTATQMLPAELLYLESSRKGMSISRRFFFFFFLGLRRSSWYHALLCSCSEDREEKVPALCAEMRVYPSD